MAGIILGALGGAGQALENIGSTMFKSELDRDARREDRLQENDLAIQRAKTLEQFKMDLHNGPLNRLGAKAREMAGQEVPQEPRAVTRVGGNVPLAEGEMGPNMPGFEGDIGIIQRAISKLPEGADKQAALAQLRRQVTGEQDFETGIVQGQRRKRTTDEALSAAVDDAKVNDLPAYAAYEKEVGKPAREERKLDLAASRDEQRTAAATREADRKAATDAQRFQVDMRRLDLQQGNLDAQNRRIDALIEHWERGDENKATAKEKSPERLYSIVNAMNQTIRNLNDSGMPREERAKAEWTQEMETAKRVRGRAQQLLDANLTDRGATGSTAPAPATPASAPVGKRPPLSSFMR